MMVVSPLYLKSFRLDERTKRKKRVQKWRDEKTKSMVVVVLSVFKSRDAEYISVESSWGGFRSSGLETCCVRCRIQVAGFQTFSGSLSIPASVLFAIIEVGNGTVPISHHEVGSGIYSRRYCCLMLRGSLLQEGV
eukprot:gb/GECG01003104.1/.p1 GENE.gb/GECG01003104.1/~~gb/GECG01003104.1/.p1  ORF type:complete len:135 (+),score=9.47 gb/GECG01003104.1/:1-405(+)